MAARATFVPDLPCGGAVLVAYRLACVSVLIALAVLSLLPADSLHRTDLGGHSEHLLAYGGAAVVLGIDPRRRTWLPLLLALIAFGGILEALQLLVPGRTSQIGDFLYSAAGVILGILVAGLLQTCLRRLVDLAG